MLTVSVSIAAGVAALTSIFPGLFEYRVAVGVGFVVLLCLGNLRGIRESGMIFTAPTYVYLVAIFGLLGYGFFRSLTGEPAAVRRRRPELARGSTGPEALGLLLILRAFASGSVALTGTEAVSNGVPAFKPPEARHAADRADPDGRLRSASSSWASASWPGQLGIVPDPTEEETVISQLTRTLVGDGQPVPLPGPALDGPAAGAGRQHRLRRLPAAGQHPGARPLPAARVPVPRRPAGLHRRHRRCSRSIAASLIVAFGGSVTNLIPLYTVGVFVAFTLSQSGMVRHWWKLRDEERGWRVRAAINGLGAVTTGDRRDRGRRLQVRAGRLDGAGADPGPDRDDVGDPGALPADGGRACGPRRRSTRAEIHPRVGRPARPSSTCRRGRRWPSRARSPATGR